MKIYIDKPISYFLIVFAFWVVGGIFMAELRDSSFSDKLIGLEISQGNSHYILYQYLIFALLILIFSCIIKNKENNYSNKMPEAMLSLVFAFFATLLKLSAYGFTVLSGDYYARFNVNANLLTNILPTVFLIISIDFFYKTNNTNPSPKHSFETENKSTKNRLFENGISGISTKTYFVICAVVSLISVLAGSRSTPFYAAISILAFFYIPINYESKIKFGIGANKVLLFLLLIYFLGQLTNILRWFSTDATIQDGFIPILSDSFPEYRSHSQTELDMQAMSVSKYGLIPWLQNLSAYILPGFVFEIFGTSRIDVFNQIWSDFFQSIIWGNKESLYGIRTGLIGEITLSLGDLYLPPVALLFAMLLMRLRSKIIVLASIVGTIPYGLTAIYILFYCILFSYLIEKITQLPLLKLK